MNRMILIGLAWTMIVGAGQAQMPPAAVAKKFAAPDPLSVKRHGTGYRYPQDGWIVLHIEGTPYDRGFQHGRLLAPEIVGYLRCFAQQQSSKAPEEGWKATRTLVNALFLRNFDREYLEEMKGIADGAAASGGKFDGRNIDLVDIAAINCWAEIETLDSALEATPHGLEGIRFPGDKPKNPIELPMPHCSAFAATGPATANGKIVFGHITMFGLAASNFYNVWLDVKPAKGHRVLMQSFPGGIQSGMDYYLTDAGLMVSETTISQTRFNINGLTLASRIRKALQYSESIDQIVDCLTKNNNGLYTNEWLMGDAKTNEIAMLQLGTGTYKLSRSSKNEWFGGTPGFYWGCNNTKDVSIRLETIPSVGDRPANLVWHPSERDKMWQRLYHQHRGKIDESFGKLAFTTPPLAAYHSLDAKFTTSDRVERLETIALFGPPLGRTWLPSDDEKRTHPEIRPLVSHPWTVLTANAPALVSPSLKVVDMSLKVGDDAESAFDDPPTVPAWYGSVLPKTDGDLWLAAAFSEYEKIAALEHALMKRNSDGKLTEADRERIALELHGYRVAFSGKPIVLSEVHRNDRDDDWYRRAVGKGVWALHSLRNLVGAATFDAAMDSFGRKHAGKPVSTAEFREHMERASKKDLSEFVDRWVTGKVKQHIAYKNPDQADDQGPLVTVRSFLQDLEHTLIVYGTQDDAAANRDAAEVLQKSLLAYGPNILVPMKADSAVTPEERQQNHLLLIGRPTTNRITNEIKDLGLIRWGTHSFTVRTYEGPDWVVDANAKVAQAFADQAKQKETSYAHAGSAVVCAMPNGKAGRAAIVIAGLGAAATRDAAEKFTSVLKHSATAVVLPAGGSPKYVVSESDREVRFAPSPFKPENSR